MRVTRVAIACALAAAAAAAQAGNFQLLADNGTLINGANNPNTDSLYLETTASTLLAGFDNTTLFGDGGPGNVVATSISYRAFSGGATTGTGTLTLLAWAERDVEPAVGPAGEMFDFVYRDSADNKLVFGLRFLNSGENEDEEANYLYRYGFTGFSASVAWTYSTDSDLRLYQAGRTNAATHAVPVAYDPDAIRLKSDISFDEGNPWSGLYLVKTDALYYTTAAVATGWSQAGEEGQQVVRATLEGFVPTNTAPIPEPQTVAMMLAGLGLLGWRLRRRQATAA